jgi:hypothetical protein
MVGTIVQNWQHRRPNVSRGLNPGVTLFGSLRFLTFATDFRFVTLQPG